MDCLLPKTKTIAEENKIRSDDPILNQWKPPLKKGATYFRGEGTLLQLNDFQRTNFVGWIFSGFSRFRKSP